MRITKFGHACVRLETGDTAVVLDPGGFTEPEAVDGATAVLITHEHPDHYSADHLRRTDAPVFTIGAVAAKIREDAPDVAERVTVVEPGPAVRRRRARAGRRREARGDPPGDAALRQQRLPARGGGPSGSTTRATRSPLPPTDVDLLLLPVSAPWLKVSECIDFARDVGAPRSLAIHDKIYSEIGLAVIEGHLQRMLGERDQSYVRLQPGDDL